MKIRKGGKSAVERVSNDIISQQRIFHLNSDVFFNLMEKKSFCRKNGFVLLKDIFDKTGRPKIC